MPDATILSIGLQIPFTSTVMQTLIGLQRRLSGKDMLALPPLDTATSRIQLPHLAFALPVDT